MSNSNSINWFEMCESLAFLKRQVTPKKTYYYFRLAKPQIKMHEPYGTQSFYEEYQSLLNNLQKQQVQETVKNVDYNILTLGGLYSAFLKSEFYESLSESTKKAKISRFEPIVKDNENVLWTQINHHAINDKLEAVRIKASETGTSGGRNQRDKVRNDFNSLFKWAIKYVPECPDDFYNPCDKTEKIQKKKHQKMQRTWKQAELDAFLDFYKSGTMQHLSVLFLSEIGTASCDLVKIGKHNLVEDTPDQIVYHRQKSGVRANQRMSQRLLNEIAKTNKCEQVFIHTKKKQAFSNGKSYATSLRKWVLQAGLDSKLTAHGLRRYAAVTAAKFGATEYELMQMFGWTTTDEPVRYIREAKNLGFIGSSKILELKAKKEANKAEKEPVEYKELEKLSTKIKLGNNINHLSGIVVRSPDLPRKK